MCRAFYVYAEEHEKGALHQPVTSADSLATEKCRGLFGRIACRRRCNTKGILWIPNRVYNIG
jgi:hypothetical protein